MILGIIHEAWILNLSLVNLIDALLRTPAAVDTGLGPEYFETPNGSVPRKGTARLNTVADRR
jgi:hypothetical protein